MSLSPVSTDQVGHLSPAMQEVAVSTYLEHARNWLSTAVEHTGPEQIAAKKAEIATAAEATKQLGLSKEIREDAAEMVRRAEYALGKAIRRGQEDGTVRKYGQHEGPTQPYTRSRQGREEHIQPALRDQKSKLSPGDYFGNGQEWTDSMALADGATDDQFNEALTDARAEGNLSRANVVRKVKKQAAPSGLTRNQRADLIADLAEQGYSSRQMAERVGVRDERVRHIAREHGIEINADKQIGKTRRMDHTAAVESAVTSLENWSSSLQYIDFAEVDPTEADEWATSLTNSLSELRRFRKQIQEMTHVQ